MPLSPPPRRDLIHTRSIECRGYRREDGLWDIEARLVDTKSYSFENEWRGVVAAGVPVHEMWLRLTVDEDLLVHGCEASSEIFPFPACGDVAPRFRTLEGLRIGPGWQREVRKRLGGVKGCTHLVELLGPIATTAFQTIAPLREKRKTADDATGERKPRLIGSCHALASDGEVVRKEWPEFYTGT